MTAARLVLPASAPREAWLAARREGITASEIAAVMGLSPWESPFALYHRKTGEIGEAPDNDAMWLGRALEDAIVARWASLHPEWYVLPGGGLYASAERVWQLATPDCLLRVAEGHRTVTTASELEVKTSGTDEGWGDDGSDLIPVYYRAQVLWQMDVLGLDELAFVACLFLRTKKLRTYTISYHAEDVATMRREALAFLDRIARRDPPPVDWMPATGRALKELHPKIEDREVEITSELAAEYETARGAVKHAEQRKRLAENRIRACMQAARVAVCSGRRVASRSVYDRTAYTVPATTIDRLVPSRRRKD